MKKHQYINPLTDMNQFVGSLQKEDNWYSKLTRIIQIMMVVLAFVYAAVFIFNPDPSINLLKRIGGFCYVLALVFFILILRKLYLEFRYVDYGLPVTEMLRHVIKRYGLFQKKLLWIIGPVLLVDASMVFITIDIENGKTVAHQIIWAQELLVPSFLLGVIIGYAIWRVRQKPLRDAAKAMLREIES
jgi:hypothetical protein